MNKGSLLYESGRIKQENMILQNSLHIGLSYLSKQLEDSGKVAACILRKPFIESFSKVQIDKVLLSEHDAPMTCSN